ncbi:TIR domain-containing protein [Bradyrhizobium sp. YCK136]|uniref:TIR domain-containing protein n=1 Tax=Bradyrhizobium sp. YCK136 TaxID=3351346 RepID=UPI0037CBB60D
MAKWVSLPIFREPNRKQDGISKSQTAFTHGLRARPDASRHQAPRAGVAASGGVHNVTSKAERLSETIKIALTQTFGPDTVEFNRYKDAARFDWQDYTEHTIRQGLQRSKERSVELLQEALLLLRNELELRSDDAAPPSVSEALPLNRPVGANIMIGHGRSPVWRELKEFVKDRLALEVEEFNAVSTAGLPTVDRLEEMLDRTGFAFLVMTAEDEQPDGRLRARENVVHEVGLFQGRLGFRKAIILLEEGCEEFSNIHGLGQIRFPKSNLTAKFEEIRRVFLSEKGC